MLNFYNKKEIDKYYIKSVNSYIFVEDKKAIDIKLNFNLDTDAHIYAGNIYAYNIKAKDITCVNLSAIDIDAFDIKVTEDIIANNINADIISAEHIVYTKKCVAYLRIKCKSKKQKKKKKRRF
jgi:hypothetical protein